jgi:putative alpha-1,2-mannosidase
VQIIGDTQVVGSASSGHFCNSANTYTVYFAAIFDHPFRTFGTWNGVSVSPGRRVQFGKQAGAYLSFEKTSNPVVQVKVGLSFVSIANAQANMAAENPGWDLECPSQCHPTHGWDICRTADLLHGSVSQSDASQRVQ